MTADDDLPPCPACGGAVSRDDGPAECLSCGRDAYAGVVGR